MRIFLLLAIAAFIGAAVSARADPEQPGSPYARWKSGPPADPAYFPIAVWLQNPRNASRYQAAGINLYVGLHRGPTEEQLAALKKARMPAICFQTELGLAHRGNPLIVGWMHKDEPDNAQSLGEGKGWGPPVPPEQIQRDYRRMRENDPSRPIFLNLGQGVAWDDYIGRGVRRNKPEDYPRYVQGADIVSFDIYPAVHAHPDVAGKLEFVARGVERLAQWAAPERITWNCIETTRIKNPDRKPTPHEVRAEVWMSIIHGSRGIIYFVHQFVPRFREAALFDDPEMLTAVTAINRRVHSLAPVLNTGLRHNDVTVRGHPDVPVAWLAMRLGEELYLFAVGMRNEAVRASFKIGGLPLAARAEVLDEGRTIEVKDGTFADDFKPYQVHLYRIAAK